MLQNDMQVHIGEDDPSSHVSSPSSLQKSASSNMTKSTEESNNNRDIELQRLDTVNKLKRSLSPKKVEHPRQSADERGKLIDISHIRELASATKRRSEQAKELFLHIVFIIILLAGITLHRSSYESYLMNQGLITAFITQQIDPSYQPFPKTFLDVGQPDELAGWLLSVIGGTLDEAVFYSGVEKTEQQKKYVMFSNLLMGGVRIRQLRAAPNKGCKMPIQLRSVTQTCYSYSISDSDKDTRPFGPPGNPQKYKYQSQDQSMSVGIYGNVLDYLEGGGYVVDVSQGGSFTDAFQELVDDTFWDNTTRAIIVTMNFLNIELESRVAVLYMYVENPGNGVFFPNFMIKTFRLNLYVTALDWFRMVLELFFALIVIYYIISEVIEMKRKKFKYFLDGWNMLELLNIVLFVTVIIMYVRYLAAPTRYKINLANRTDYFVEMERIAADALNFYNVCAVNVILTAFRTFKFLRLNARLYVLWKALRYAGVDLLGFLVIFFVFVFGFIFMGWLAFGSDIFGFSTFFRSFGTCWNFIIGNAPDYDDIVKSNRVLGPIFFVLFTIFIFFILINMFIAIVSQSFETVSPKNNKFKLQKSIAQLFNLVERKVSELLGRKKRKRTMMLVLDNLAHPEILDEPNLTIDKILDAIGTEGTLEEATELLTYIHKVERRKTKEAGEDEQETQRDSVKLGNIGKAQVVAMEDVDINRALEALQQQIAELKQLLTKGKTPRP